jgi:hypothetical protein
VEQLLSNAQEREWFIEMVKQEHEDYVKLSWPSLQKIFLLVNVVILNQKNNGPEGLFLMLLFNQLTCPLVKKGSC